ncbi:nucleotidyltransferase domain-containing protein [Duganella qianjiadongensis]|uniref:Nucleotidyltransferase domain-containing protein n=1 Tax=Duganella qianjiadongensis TaxID=2692176 RepID=A0ABW9VQB4_9BURK|nr:nucleotidyltransferase domain-containing protein [Duganella qianjiadongensis]MYM41356.1 nucleotidyltransferase domain-containing protein [Duganella qianjiadongensis]
MIPTDIREQILQRLHDAEVEHGIQILLAVESGSRAWGFPSPNSDYDVRFIYVRPRDWYLSIALEEQRDVIEYPIVDEIDINGWDLRKALRLFAKSNPAFVEWIRSPIIYSERGSFADQARQLLPAVYSCERGIHHYRSAAVTTFRHYMKGDLIPLKKYFYALRPLLSVRWLEKYRTAAPIEFDQLLPLIEGESELVREIQALLVKKSAAPEMGLDRRVARIDAFIEAELARLASFVPDPSHNPQALPLLNVLFLQVLEQTWRSALCPEQMA